MDYNAYHVREVLGVYRFIVVIHFFVCCSLWGPFNAVMFNSIIFLLTMSHFKAVLSDPGTVPLPQNRLDFSDIHSSETGV